MEGPSMDSKKEIFTCSEITEITRTFKACIGQGGFGQVFLGVMNDGTLVAVKILSTQDSKDFSAEVKLLKISHTNLVALVGYCNEDAKKALIYEYIGNGDLLQHLSENSERSLSWNERLKIVEDIAEGINFLHSQKPSIIHRNLKPANILLTEDMQVKIADLGLSRAFPTEFATYVSTRPADTLGYLDPTTLLGKACKEHDVFSFGVILLVLLIGKPAIIEEEGRNPINIIDWTNSAIHSKSIPEIIDPRLQGEVNIHAAAKAIKLAISCVNSDIAKRQDMSHVLKKLKAIPNLKQKTGYLTSLATLAIRYSASPNSQSQNVSDQMEYSDKPSFKVYCRTDPAFSLSIRDTKEVILAPTNASDPLQHWYKDESYGSTVTDDKGVPSFALVNKATGQAIKHSIKANHPVQLVSHNPKKVDNSVLWTEDKKSESGYKSIQMVTNTTLCIDIFNVCAAEGAYVILCPRNSSYNQWWKIEQHSASDPPSSSSANSQNVSYQKELSDKPSFIVHCMIDPEFSLSIKDGKVILAQTNASDPLQHWYKDEECGSTVKNNRTPSFALVNKATAQAIKCSTEADHPVKLVSYDSIEVDESVLWTEEDSSNGGYKSIQSTTNTSLYMDAHKEKMYLDAHQKKEIYRDVILWPRNNSNNQLWMIQQHRDGHQENCDFPR